MNILLKKLKKISITKKIAYFLTSILYLIALIYFIYGLLHLKGIETFLRIIIIILFILWFTGYSLFGLLSLLQKRNKTFVIMTLITFILIPIFTISSYYINKVYSSMSRMNRNTITYTTNLIALKKTEFSNKTIIGMIETETDIEGNQLAKTLIQKNNLTNKIKTYEDYTQMIKDLYDDKIGACFVSSNYAVNFSGETFGIENDTETIADKVKVLYAYSEDRENQDIETINNTNANASKKQLTEPFTILIMGVDSEEDGLKANQAFNGDTLIMVTFNPKTLTTTMFSIPRDLYVPIACNNDRYAKINSSAAYGSSCVISTIQKLTNINIDYYVKMNFKGVVDLVDALGGVTVNVEEPDYRYNAGYDCKGKVCEQNSLRQFGSEMIYIDTGIQTLNGEQALAYARCRHLYAMSDIARNQHQQDIIAAMAQKLKTLRSVNDFENLLDIVSKNIETNMTPEQILSFYNVGKDMLTNASKDSEALSIKKTYLTYYNLKVWRGYVTDSLGYYKPSLDAITKLMRVNLGLEKEEATRTFSISYDEDYETPLVGYGITGGEKLEVMPNYIGYEKEYVSNWCNDKDLSCSFEAVDSELEYGTIIEQSAHELELLKTLRNITFQYSNHKSPSNNEDNNQNNGNTLKNYVGYDKDYVKNWCYKNEIECSFTSTESSLEKNSILKQSVKEGTPLEEIEEIEFTYSDGSLSNNNNKDDDENKEPEDPGTSVVIPKPEPDPTPNPDPDEIVGEPSDKEEFE